MSKGVTFEEFSSNVKLLEENNIIKKTYIYGYKKTFKDFIIDNKLGYKKGKSVYLKSHIDNNEYCLTNGAFKRHLDKNNLSEIDYLLKSEADVPMGFKQTFNIDGKNIKKYFIDNYNIELYKIYRSILTSVSSDYKKLMLYYGISKQEAKNISLKSFNKRSKGLSGKNNGSYGKTGLNANCYKPFINTESPKENYSKFLKEKNKILILKWASDNNIDETSFETIKFKYYSSVFKNIHLLKGQEYLNNSSIDISTEQAIYLYNKEKSLSNYSAKNFIEYNTAIINRCGTKDDIILFNKLLKNKDYNGIMSLCCSVKNINEWGKRVYYKSNKYGDFALRSKLEKGFVFIADRLDIINDIKSESIRIPYNNGKSKIYIIDFEISLNNGKKILIEVKPYKQCVIPEGDILLKKEAAELYAKKHKYKYMFITEKDMKYEYIRKKLQSC